MRSWTWHIGRQPAATARLATRAERQLPLFLRRLAKLGALICLLLVAGMLGFAASEAGPAAGSAPAGGEFDPAVPASASQPRRERRVVKPKA
jgi:hypothetical protein